MRTNRRGFLAALVAAPVLAGLMPTGRGTQTSRIRLLRYNVWSKSGVELNEAIFTRFLEEQLRPRKPNRFVVGR